VTNSDTLLAVDAAVPDSPFEARDPDGEAETVAASSPGVNGDGRRARPPAWRPAGASPAEDIRRAEAWLAERQIGPIV
jgi:hypothetical protein